MLRLNEIGELSLSVDHQTLRINSDYRKALKYIECFEYHHIFCIDHQNNPQIIIFICKLKELNHKDGILELDINPKQLNHRLDCKDGILTGQSVSLSVIDIKPYFPCEDSVKAICKQNSNSSCITVTNQTDYWGVSELGKIRNSHGHLYIELETWDIPDTDYIKILWWFNKFDKNVYRRTTICNPPYENAPQTGIFATRSPVRPNPIAMTVAKVIHKDAIRKRIYINKIEAFDQTPCIGILPYETDYDLYVDARVPEWLSHWPKWYSDKPDIVSDDMLEMKESKVVELLHQNALDQSFVHNQSNFNDNGDSSPSGLIVHGAKEHNLKNIDVTIPYGKITAVVGVSGSGKSTLVKDTIYAECRRRMEYLTSNRNTLSKPKMDSMHGCIPAVLISQEEIHSNSNSTIGTYTNAYDYLRLLYTQIGVRHCPECGNEIVSLTENKINQLLQPYENVTIYDTNNQIIKGDNKQQRITKALEKGKGAMFVKINKKGKLLLQTKQKCYRCDRIMFELTPGSFSYIDSESRCPVCNGTGFVSDIKEETIVEKPELSILDGAIPFYGKLREFMQKPNANWMKGQVFGLAETLHEDLNKKWIELSEQFRHSILYGTDMLVTFHYNNSKNGRSGDITRTVEGIIPIIQRLLEEHPDQKSLQKYKTMKKCSACAGERLNKEARMVTIHEIRYPVAAKMSFEEMITFCKELPEYLTDTEYQKSSNTINSLLEIAQSAVKLGIGYLNLDRLTAHMSGGEAQRVKLLSAMMNHMSGILYIFDEPSKGLSPKDYSKVAYMIQQLKHEGNTIIMVEHNEDMIKTADYMIEIGPDAGVNGGNIVALGSSDLIMKQILLQRKQKNIVKHKLDQLICLDHLNKNNLKDISIHIPIQALTCICGVSGSGKSSLVKQEIFVNPQIHKQFVDIILVDQLPIGKSSKSVIATYIGIMDDIRVLFASVPDSISKGYDESYFSFNSAMGQCPACKGEGMIRLKYPSDCYIPCPDCKGKRYLKKILDICYEGKNLNDILELSVHEAIDFFQNNDLIRSKLRIVDHVGLGYLKLGQSTITLSGGESSRLKLSRELVKVHQTNTLYLLDEPTTGLHYSDIDRLLTLINELIKDGNTVVAIEHNKQFIDNCDWFIELGPQAGELGGSVMYEGKNRP